MKKRVGLIVICIVEALIFMGLYIGAEYVLDSCVEQISLLSVRLPKEDKIELINNYISTSNDPSVSTVSWLLLLYNICYYVGLFGMIVSGVQLVFGQLANLHLVFFILSIISGVFTAPLGIGFVYIKYVRQLREYVSPENGAERKAERKMRKQKKSDPKYKYACKMMRLRKLKMLLMYVFILILNPFVALAVTFSLPWSGEVIKYAEVIIFGAFAVFWVGGALLSYKLKIGNPFDTYDVTKIKTKTDIDADIEHHEGILLFDYDELKIKRADTRVVDEEYYQTSRPKALFTIYLILYPILTPLIIAGFLVTLFTPVDSSKIYPTLSYPDNLPRNLIKLNNSIGYFMSFVCGFVFVDSSFFDFMIVYYDKYYR